MYILGRGLGMLSMSELARKISRKRVFYRGFLVIPALSLLLSWYLGTVSHNQTLNSYQLA
jgi:hypothetical protein